MPKLKETPTQRMQRVFRAVVMYNLERRGETVMDLAKIAPRGQATVYRRMKQPEFCTMQEMLFYVPRFFNDRQLCEMFGVEYHGNTLSEG